MTLSEGERGNLKDNIPRPVSIVGFECSFYKLKFALT